MSPRLPHSSRFALGLSSSSQWAQRRIAWLDNLVSRYQLGLWFEGIRGVLRFLQDEDFINESRRFSVIDASILHGIQNGEERNLELFDVELFGRLLSCVDQVDNEVGVGQRVSDGQLAMERRSVGNTFRQKCAQPDRRPVIGPVRLVSLVALQGYRCIRVLEDLVEVQNDL